MASRMPCQLHSRRQVFSLVLQLLRKPSVVPQAIAGCATRMMLHAHAACLACPRAVRTRVAKSGALQAANLSLTSLLTSSAYDVNSAEPLMP